MVKREEGQNRFTVTTIGIMITTATYTSARPPTFASRAVSMPWESSVRR